MLSNEHVIRFIKEAEVYYGGDLSPHGANYVTDDMFDSEEYDEIRVCYHLLPFLNVKLLKKSSYGLKHVIEAMVNRYISNGSLIVAAHALGLKGTVEDTPNVIFKSGHNTLLERRSSARTIVLENQPIFGEEPYGIDNRT